MKCSFCKEDIHKGSGKIFVTKSGSVKWYCSSKCERNFNLGRKPRKVKWITKKKKTKE